MVLTRMKLFHEGMVGRMSTWSFARLFLLLTIFGIQVGCAAYTDIPPGTCKPIGPTSSAVIERQPISVPVQDLDEPPPDEYIVGPNDILTVTYKGAYNSDVTAESGPDSAEKEKVRGSKVDGTGHIYLSLVGKIKVGGLTTWQVQDRIREALESYIKEPSVVVEVAKPYSQPLYLIGHFNKPGVYFMDRAINLIQGMALGSGPANSANLRSARLLRNKKLVPVDIYEALVHGDLRHNAWLKAGDTIYLPDTNNQNVFVFGAVKNQGAVAMANGQLSLAQALTYGGLGEFSFDPRIRIIRSLSTTRGELYVVDFNRIMSGEAPQFMLSEGDVIYVPRSFVANWNQALTEMLPTLQAFSAVLNPFVQIKFLFDLK